MSNISLKWIQQNFGLEHHNIFDIGCADLHDACQFLDHTDGKVFAFECNPVWSEQNLERSKNIDRLYYYDCAISDKDGTEDFVPSDSLDGQEWNWSGSLFAPTENLKTDKWTWKDAVSVVSRSIDSICLENQCVPNFIHIDAQGAEYKIFKDMIARPMAIWCEISEFENYDTGVKRTDFHSMMLSKGYMLVHTQECDALYVLNKNNLTKYS